MVSCASCGTLVAEDAKFCAKCGAVQPARPAPPAGPQPPVMPGMQPPMPASPYGGSMAARRTEGTAIASLVLGIAGIIICPLVCSILAIIFGSQAKSKIARDPSLEGAGMAKAGFILGWIGVAFTIFWVLLVIGILNSADSININPMPIYTG